jgi:hypothetical protein
VNAATTGEWIGALALGTTAFIPGALLILALDHNLRPRIPHIDLTPALDTAARAMQWTRVQAAALLLLAAWHIEPKAATR